MLRESYIHEQLARLEQHPSHAAAHAFEIEKLRRRNSSIRRAARLVGRGLSELAERLIAYGSDRPQARLGLPKPPIVDLPTYTQPVLRPGSTPFSQN